MSLLKLRPLALLLVLSILAGCTATPTPTAAPTLPPATEVPPSPTPLPTAGPVSLINPGFEEQTAEGAPTGWTSSGTADAVLVEKQGYENTLRLTHKNAASFQVETSQTASGLADDWYTLRARVRSSGNNEAYMALQCGGTEERVYIPATTPGYRWLELTVSNQAADGQCTILLHTFGLPDTWASFDNIELLPGRTALSILGADISSLHKSEDLGGIYKYADGTQADALQILKDNGMNYARLRVWVDPADGYHDKAEILLMAQRFKEMGLKLLVDFHYSDDWADPGKQYKPAAWKDYTVEQLTQAVYDYTYDVCSSLAAQGTPADMVQIGNEINAGILWPEGDYNHFDNLAAFLTTGYQAAKDANSATLVMLHIAEGGDNSMARWFFDNLTRRNVPFDIIGLSYYPFWHGSLMELQDNLVDVSARYDKDVLVAEVAYAFTAQEGDEFSNLLARHMAVDGYLYTPEGQRQMLRDVMSVVRGVPGGRGLGVFYWDATWTAVTGNGWNSQDSTSGNSWENQALFDYNFRALPALAEFLNP